MFKFRWLLASALISSPAFANDGSVDIANMADSPEAVTSTQLAESRVASPVVATLKPGLSALNTTGAAANWSFNLAGGSDSSAETSSEGGGSSAAGRDSSGGEGATSGHGLPNFLNTSVQYGYSWDADNDFILGYGSDAEDRHQIRIEHQQTWKYGNIYFFFDRVSSPLDLGGERDFGFPCCGDGKNAEVYTVFNGNVSLSRVLDKPIKVGPFKDFGIEVRGEYGSFFDYKAFGIGLSADINIPGFDKPGDYVRLNWWRRFNDDEFVSAPFDAGGAATTRYADHNLWGLTIRKTFNIGSTKLSHQTFFRYQQKAKGGANELERFNRIFLENEFFVYLTNRFSVGFRSEYFRDSGGISFGGTKSDWRPIVAIKFDLFNR